MRAKLLGVLAIGLLGCGGTTNNITLRTGPAPQDFDFAAAPGSANRNVLTPAGELAGNVNVLVEAPRSRARCQVNTDAGSDAALSDDGTLMAAMLGGRLAIIDTRSCSTVRAFTYTSKALAYPTIYNGSGRGYTRVIPARDTAVRAIAFAGTSHDVLLLRDQGIERLSPDGTVRSGAFGYHVQRWAISPDGERIVLAFDGTRPHGTSYDARATSPALAVFDGKLVEQRRVRLGDAEEIDGLAFIPSTGKLIVTQPTSGAAGMGASGAGRRYAHVATEIDLATYRIDRRQRLAWGQPQRTLVPVDRGSTLVWGGMRFDRDGGLTQLEDYAWQTSAGGSVAVASDERGYFVWNVDGRRDVRRLATHATQLPSGELGGVVRTYLRSGNAYGPSHSYASYSGGGYATHYADVAYAAAHQIPVGVGVDGSVLFCGGSVCDVVEALPASATPSKTTTTALKRSASR